MGKNFRDINVYFGASAGNSLSLFDSRVQLMATPQSDGKIWMPNPPPRTPSYAVITEVKDNYATNKRRHRFYVKLPSSYRSSYTITATFSSLYYASGYSVTVTVTGNDAGGTIHLNNGSYLITQYSTYMDEETEVPIYGTGEITIKIKDNHSGLTYSETLSVRY